IEYDHQEALRLTEKFSVDVDIQYDIEHVTCLEDAVGKLNIENYDAVLTNIHPPDDPESNIVSSLLVLNEKLPIVVLTRDTGEHLALKVIQSGAQDFLNSSTTNIHQIIHALDHAIRRKKVEHHLAYYAQIDNLTGLANRSLFKERLTRALIRADRNKKIVALMVIDIDRFKYVNDSLGHEVGDQLLKLIAKRLTYCIREGDTVARLGGDEFTVLLEDVSHIGDASLVANKILEAMMKPFVINGEELYITPSIGITLYPVDDTRAQFLLRNADNAMYRAKQGGRNCYRFYTTDMDQHLEERVQIESRLRHAVANKEFQLHYQPKFNIHDNQLVGAEALLRWDNADLGVVSPAVFIPVAEETGLIQPITEWVVKEACEQNANWQLKGFKPIRMSVNLSPKQFTRTDIAGTIFHQIIHADLAPKYVELEITEGALMEDVNKSQEVLKALKKWGIRISIDDFGTGYSSLSYLKKFPIDTLKIDQSFVRDIMVDSDDAAIVSAIIAMTQSLKLNVIAEGVETEDQLRFLASKGCNEAQGYFLGKPVAATEFESIFLSAHTSNNVYSIAS
ncbi:MAG: EAL domain-containing protein, partial [Pseudomonadota bacterium]